ncbi:hypothetical protein FH972_009380 [Carpinus fangiana]|uniref:Uncharacterized protein n=1 Tax=Carpinus fangiana TaxID=176857 RepID=A0A5N6R1N8_9ROSI|nr:hypothetical protein FH972_009380 [Carpinus fangiana]
MSKMERNQKRRGFMKSILSIVAKPSAPVQCSSKVKPSPPSQPRQSGHVRFYKEEISSAKIPPSMPRTFSAAKPVAGFYGSSTTGVFNDYGGDENVDMKAANYISNVRERFKLANVDLGHRMR